MEDSAWATILVGVFMAGSAGYLGWFRAVTRRLDSIEDDHRFLRALASAMRKKEEAEADKMYRRMGGSK